MKEKITEQMLASAFERLLSDSHHADGFPFPTFDQLTKEMDCQQGRPDYVASTSKLPESINSERVTLGKVLSTPSSSKILAVLSPDCPKSKRDLQISTGYSIATVRKGLKLLLETNLVIATNKDQYLLSSLTSQLEPELWAFELKLSNWKRALYQALQYRTFAQYAVVVVLETWAHRAEKHRSNFEVLGIGVSAIDLETQRVRTITPPKKREPSSRFHYYYALGKFLNAAQ